VRFSKLAQPLFAETDFFFSLKRTYSLSTPQYGRFSKLAQPLFAETGFFFLAETGCWKEHIL
jgi:hypothetical protein